jgi:pyruvate dehydrogenase E1 component alpha subunit
VEKAREGDGPIFIEAYTYRYSDHGRGDPIKYRPEGEMERWRERDPLEIARARLAGDHGVEEPELDAVVAGVEEEVEALTREALDSPFPEPDPRATEFAT